MSKPKAPELPPTPTFQADPIASAIPGQLQSYGQGLLSSSLLTDPVLGEAVNLNPQMTQLMLQNLQAQLAPSLRQSRQDTVNTLEANNQLTGSTTASALGNIQSDYESQLISAGAQAGMADINRALQNRVGLYGTGLNTLQAAGSMAQGNQSQINSFNMENYQNQVAKVLAEQKQNTGGLAGGLTGAIGGGLAGLATGNPIFAGIGAVAGGVSGAFGPSGTGGSLMTGAAGLYGNQYKYPTTTAQRYSPIYSGAQIDDILKNPQPIGLRSY